MDQTSKPSAPLDRKLYVMREARRWIKRARVVLALALLLIAIYAILSYRLFAIGGDASLPSPVNGIKAGDYLLWLNLNLGREPRLGDIVVYTFEGQTLIGRVAGMPGESVVRDGPSMSVGGRPRLGIAWGYGTGEKVDDGDVIPEGQYLIVVDRDDAAYTDSRRLGTIPREAILRRMVLNGSTWSGPARAGH